MIPSAIELATSVYGALRLAKLDRAGIGLFNATIEGFWRSFFAAILVAPGYLLVLILSFSNEPLSASVGRVIVVETLAYVITWVSFPLVMFYLAQNLDRSGDYLRYIVAFNWAQVMEIALYVPVLVLVKQEIVTGPLGTLLQFAAYLAILGYEWFIAMVGLRLTRLPAAGIVLVALALNLLISVFAHGMIR